MEKLVRRPTNLLLAFDDGSVILYTVLGENRFFVEEQSKHFFVI